MKNLIPFLLCAALGACASPHSKEAAPTPVESRSAATPAPADEVATSLPEVRYYVISDG